MLWNKYTVKPLLSIPLNYGHWLVDDFFWYQGQATNSYNHNIIFLNYNIIYHYEDVILLFVNLTQNSLRV